MEIGGRQDLDMEIGGDEGPLYGLLGGGRILILRLCGRKDHYMEDQTGGSDKMDAILLI